MFRCSISVYFFLNLSLLRGISVLFFVCVVVHSCISDCFCSLPGSQGGSVPEHCGALKWKCAQNMHCAAPNWKDARISKKSLVAFIKAHTGTSIYLKPNLVAETRTSAKIVRAERRTSAWLTEESRIVLLAELRDLLFPGVRWEKSLKTEYLLCFGNCTESWKWLRIVCWLFSANWLHSWKCSEGQWSFISQISHFRRCTFLGNWVADALY